MEYKCIFLLQVAVSFWHPSVHSTLSNDQAGRAPVVSSKHALLLFYWYNNPPLFPTKELGGKKQGVCVCVACVCVCVCVCAQIKGSIHEKYWQGCALSDIVVLSYVSKVVVDDTGCKSRINES